jgi:hypothetical protein
MEMLDYDGPVIFDCLVEKHENCFPMIPSGKAHNEMLLGEAETKGAIGAVWHRAKSRSCCPAVTTSALRRQWRAPENRRPLIPTRQPGVRFRSDPNRRASREGGAGMIADSPAVPWNIPTVIGLGCYPPPRPTTTFILSHW